MQKDFDGWSTEKQKLDNADKVLYPHSREIWATKIGTNIGFEENGKSGYMRPVLVIKKIGKLYFVIPMTTKGKENHIYYYSISSIDFGKPSRLLLSQGRVIDAKRCILKIAKLGKEEFDKIKNTLVGMYF